MKLRIPIAVAGALVLLAVGTAPGAAAHSKGAPVEGVFSPLGFAIAPNGTFFVAEAFSGQLTKVDRWGNRTALVDPVEGQFTAGVDVRGNKVSYTLSLPPEFQDGPPTDTTLNTVTRSGQPLQSVSLLDYEEANNPDAVNLYGIVDAGECQDAIAALSDFLGPAAYPGQVESNPYAVANDWGNSRVVADAAGNSLLRVRGNGTVSTIAVLPPVPQILTEETLGGLLADINAALEEAYEPTLPDDALDACIGQTYQSNPVPTDVEIGPKGHYYVSALPGFPESAGSGTVFKVNRWTGAVTKVAGGFTGAVDIAVARNGTLYVAELFAFQVSTVKRGESTASSSVPVNCPTALELDERDRLWVAEGGICSDGPPQPGRIVRLKA